MQIVEDGGCNEARGVRIGFQRLEDLSCSDGLRLRAPRVVVRGGRNEGVAVSEDARQRHIT